MYMTNIVNSTSTCDDKAKINRGCTINFGAGPAALPEIVLHQFTRDLINFSDSPGLGIAELSHRTEAFERGILEKASRAVYELSGYAKEDWTVLWMTGGGTGQFAGVPLNFGNGKGKKAVYLITGIWSLKAGEEAKKILGEHEVVIVDLRQNKSQEKTQNSFTLKQPEEWIDEVIKIQDEISYIYYCDNETIEGIELPHPNYFQNLLEPRFNDKTKTSSSSSPVMFVGDMSSNFFSRKLPDSTGGTGLLFGGVQKNLGAAGVTLVLIKNKILEERIGGISWCPSILDYKLTAKNNSMLNTPPVMAIHMCNLVLQNLLNRWRGTENVNNDNINEIKSKNYLENLDEFSKKKSEMLYEAIERSNKFYCPVEKEFRSRMNVVFKAIDDLDSSVIGDFLKKAQDKGMIQLKGHRSVGGLRASLYNAIEIEQVQKLVSLIDEEN